MSALWMILASFFFASMGVCVKLGAGHFSTAELTFYRGAIGVLVMSLLMWHRGTPLRTPHWRRQITRALAGTLSLACYFFAIGSLPLATAVTLNYTSPLFVALLLAFWYREPLPRTAVGALLVGFAGVVVLLRPTLASDQWIGALAGLGTGVIASLAYLHVRELGRMGEPETRTVLWFSSVTALTMLPVVLAGDGFTLPDGRGAGILAGVGLFGAAAQLAMTRAYRYGPTIVAANLAYATVVFASLFGIWLWDEALSSSGVIGMLLIAASGILVSRARQRAPSPRRTD
ncbi:DMT family transporter [Nitrogeniibacter mangrovi]|uniref:DMT family transporter n=1 Tax=Nitrogeniibacter mangrovi TaxID=2016596 RepID=A0A6C1B5E3_9RHOO|nr:DMT family transporter [Nitrogeniibacter mangrovi]QID18663.1 DMT family transporter [Nitrogeniibacter mangrovi]